mmetsp:Transcript_543/g.1580  ORF Transcript_543/g.1580 Transcript_543/m.1580 type:complete len:539 (+) Transcript_543:100-1716(+)
MAAAQPAATAAAVGDAAGAAGHDELAVPAEGAPSVVVDVPLAAVWGSLKIEQKGTPPPELAAINSISSFTETMRQLAESWAALFKEIPASSEARKDALKGALMIKQAGKALDAIEPAAVGGSSVPAATGGDEAPPPAAAAAAAAPADPGALTAGPATETPPSGVAALVECQRLYRDMVHGLLDISFPLDQKLAADDFSDAAAAEAAFGRLRQARDLVEVLGAQFASATVDPKATAEPKKEDALPPELLKMLEKAMGEKKTTPAIEDQPGRQEQMEAWEKGHGRLSCVIGKELYEGLCYRLAMLDFMYIKSLVDTVKADPAASPEALTVNRVNTAIWHFENMMRAQGPIGSTTDSPTVWKPATTAQHSDETARLFHHAIYSSHNLRALKHQAELCYWRWKYVTQTRDDAVFAAIVNRKFVHIIRHIIPGRGWLADAEYDRVCELDNALQTTFFRTDLDKKPPLQIQAEKGEKKKALKGKGGGGGGAAAATLAAALADKGVAVDGQVGQEIAKALSAQGDGGQPPKPSGGGGGGGCCVLI